MNTLGPKLQKIRESKKLSADGLAGAVNCRLRAITLLESGQSDPPLSLLQKLSKVLGVWIVVAPGDVCWVTETPPVRKAKR